MEINVPLIVFLLFSGACIWFFIPKDTSLPLTNSGRRKAQRRKRPRPQSKDRRKSSRRTMARLDNKSLDKFVKK